MELTKKQLREQREFETLFKNPKHAREMWAEKVFERYSRPAMEPCIITDKDGNATPQSQLEHHVWHFLKKELESRGEDRLPTSGEMIEACQDYYSRHNAASYIARRDSIGAKPVDESKQQHTVNNPLEDMTDDELQVMYDALQAYRATLLESQKGAVK